MSEWKEVWYAWDGKQNIPKNVFKALCKCEVLIDDKAYLNSVSVEALEDWYGVIGQKPFIQLYTLGEKRHRCQTCNGKGFIRSGGVSSGGIIMGSKNKCNTCNGTGWEYKK